MPPTTSRRLTTTSSGRPRSRRRLHGPARPGRAARGPLAETVQLDDGSVWRNVVTPAKAKVAETLEEFRGNRGKRAFLEHNPLRFACDDPERVYRRVPCGPLIDLFALDMRSERGPNSENRQSVRGPMPLGLVVRDGEGKDLRAPRHLPAPVFGVNTRRS